MNYEKMFLDKYNYLYSNIDFSFLIYLPLFLYKIIYFIFYYFNGGMKGFYWRGGNFLPWIN